MQRLRRVDNDFVSPQTPLPRRRDARPAESVHPDGPTQHTSDAESNVWASHKSWAAALRWTILLLPSALSFFVTFAFSRRFPPYLFLGGTPRVLWWISLFSVGLVVLLTAEKVARRMLPLATLFKLSLVFPDAAPSRFSVAMRTNTTRKLQLRLNDIRENGLPEDRKEHAELMLELVAALSIHDRLTRGHCERVRAYTDLIAEEMKIPEADAAKLRWAALLHDVGKIYVASEILNKSGRPTEDEWESLKSHTWKGDELISPLAGFLGEWGLAVRNHHERWDGNGYPDCLAGDRIPLGGRIVAVADAFDVMTSARSYKEPRPASEARAEIARCAGGQFDPEVARAFLNIGLGKLRFAVGPLSWLANFAGAANVPAVVSSGAPAVFASVTAVVGITMGSVGQPETIAFEAPPTTVVTPAEAELPITQPTPEFLPPTPGAEAGVVTIGEDQAGPVLLAAKPNGAEVIFILIKGPRNGKLSLPRDGTGMNFLTADGTQVVQNEQLPVDLPFNASPVPEGSTVTLTGIYTPNSNFSGRDSFRFRVCNATNLGYCSDNTVSVQVSPVNDLPIVANEVITIDEDAPLRVTPNLVLANDSDVDGDELRVLWIKPETGTTKIIDGVLTYQMPPNRTTDFNVEYRVCDLADCATARVEVKVNPLDDAPLANDDVLVANEDLPLAVSPSMVLANDKEFDGDPLIVTFDPHPAFDPATSTFLPPLNSNDPVTWGYTVCDYESSLCDRATVTINIIPSADAPVAAGESLPAVDEDKPINGLNSLVLANDFDPDNDPNEPMTIDWGTPSVTGLSFTTDAAGFVYKPPLDFAGEVTIPYRVCDLTLCSESVNLILKFRAVNDAPTVPPLRTIAATEDIPTTVSFANLIAGATDPDSTVLSVQILGPYPSGFTLQPNATSPTGFIHTPVPESFGPTTIDYKICDDKAKCTTAELILDYAAVDDPPSPASGVESTVEDVNYRMPAAAFEALVGDVDTAFADLSINFSSSNPGLGSVVLDAATNDLLFIVSPDQFGVTTITYEVCDLTTTTGCPTADITMNVTANNDAPKIDVPALSIAGTEDIATVINPGDLDALVSDIDNTDSELEFTFTSTGSGVLTVHPSNRGFTYTPQPESSADVDITYTLCDTGLPAQCAPGSGVLTLSFAPVDDPPAPTGLVLPSQPENTAITITRADLEAAANDIDTAGADLTFFVGSPPATDDALGMPTEIAPGSDWVLNPILNANGTATYPFTVCDTNTDPGPNCEVLEVKLTLTSVNAKPVIDTTIPIAFAGTEDALLSVRSADLKALGFVTDSDDSFSDLKFVYTEPTVDGGVNPIDDIFERRENGRAFRYTPAPDSVKDVTITFVACDDEGACSDQTGVITLTFGPQDDPPAPSDLVVPAVDEDSVTSITVSRAQLELQANDVDTAGVDLSFDFALIGGDDLGTFDDSTGDFVLNVNPDANGATSYLVTVCDQKPNCETFQLIFTVTPTPDAPILISPPSPTTTLFIPPTPVDLGNDWVVKELDGEIVTAVPDPLDPAVGSLAFSGDHWVFTPGDPIPVGTSVSIGLRLCDTTTPVPLCVPTAWTVVAAVNHPPQLDSPFSIGTQHVNVPMPSPVTFSVSDTEGDAITVTHNLPTGLDIADNGDGTYTISGTPTDPSRLGTNRNYRITLSDIAGGSTSFNVRIRFSDQGLSPHRGEVIITEVAAQDVVACQVVWLPWFGPIEICADVEGLELYNPTASTTSLSGWVVQDFAPGTSPDWWGGSISLPVETDVPSLDADEYGIFTTFLKGSDNTPFNWSGDDIWLLDENGLIVDYVGWQHSNWLAWGQPAVPIPDAELGIWDTNYDAMAEIGYRPSGPAWTISLATRTNAATAACWELTSTGDALSGTHVCGAPDATQTIDHPDAQGLYDTDPSYTHSLSFPNWI